MPRHTLEPVKALRFIFLAMALLLQGSGAVAMEPFQEPAGCCCEDRCPCPMPPPSAPRAPEAPSASQTPVTQAPEQAAPARAPRIEPRAWSGLSLDVTSSEVVPTAAVRPEADPPGGRQWLSRISTLRI
ncbi:MAG: hypothetical protein HYZ13_12820 [Acidobacteria bacterium]|nr:hypothetical protein [Acidobacteriota bacterium]